MKVHACVYLHYKTVASISTCAIFVMLNWTSLKLLLGIVFMSVFPMLSGHVSWEPVRDEAVDRDRACDLGGMFCAVVAAACFFLRSVSIQLVLCREVNVVRASELRRIFLPDVISSPKPS